MISRSRRSNQPVSVGSNRRSAETSITSRELTSQRGSGVANKSDETWDTTVFPLHGLGPGASGFPPTTTIATELSAVDQANLLVFLKSIDGTTASLRSEGDDFRDAVRMQGPCPPPATMTSIFGNVLGNQVPRSPQ